MNREGRAGVPGGAARRAGGPAGVRVGGAPPGLVAAGAIYYS